MSAMEEMGGKESEPFVVLPMPQMHSGIKRISAYDFEVGSVGRNA